MKELRNAWFPDVVKGKKQERSVPMPRAKKSKNKAKTGGKKKAAAGNK